MKRPAFYEFFAGGGMARLGLGPHWTCLRANEWDAKKAESYRRNFDPADDLLVGDVNDLTERDLPGQADLAWASFPCQDLSLAGGGAGLKGARSSAFFGFWRLMKGLAAQGRAPRTIVLENVTGLLSSHGGHDFRAILELLAGAGYRTGAVIGDAVHFLPQSRPRLFIIATRADPSPVQTDGPIAPWHPPRLAAAVDRLSPDLRRDWVWWDMPQPAPARTTDLSDILIDRPNDAPFHTPEETDRLVSMMDAANRRRLAAALAEKRPIAGTLYRRTRRGSDGTPEQRAELRLDGVAGCLRTPAGGSSRQTVMLIHGGVKLAVRSRLLSAREGARLMGVPDAYVLPERYNAAYHLIGDGVAAPVVRALERAVLRPLASQG
ncbi:MAG: DNA cytosine methyltransferase [Alphaproteobacteria bacterium]|nr:DNA cytosine methyltransferase [Alphaproteobacteria bacterium]